jgi:CRP/FNR family cyclic AMP-dependent transcriptional regulator
LTVDALGPNNTFLSSELLTQLGNRGDAKAYAKNETIFAEGDASDALYILVSGQLKVFTTGTNGRELVYNTIQPGEFFGELFLDGGPRSASVKAMVDSQCVKVSQAQMRSFIDDYPKFAECLIHSLIHRLRHATELSKSLALNDVYQRTVALLNRMAVTDGPDRIVPPALTQQEIADRVGASREMINQVIGELMRGGFLARDDRRRMIFMKELPNHW